MEDEDEDTIIVAGPLRDNFLRVSALRNEPLYADRGPDQILDARVLQNGEYIYLVKRTGQQAHQWKWETADEGRLSEAMIQTWLESDIHLAELVGPPDLDEYRREQYVRIEVDKIIGEDADNFLVAWRPHPSTGAQLKPFWWSREKIDPELHHEWFELIQTMQKELEAWLDSHDDQRGFWPEYVLPAQGRFFAILTRPVSKAVRDFIEESYPDVFVEIDGISSGRKKVEGESQSETDSDADMGEDIACDNEGASGVRSDLAPAEDSSTETSDQSESDGEQDRDEDGDADDEEEEIENDEYDSGDD